MTSCTPAVVVILFVVVVVPVRPFDLMVLLFSVRTEADAAAPPAVRVPRESAAVDIMGLTALTLPWAAAVLGFVLLIELGRTCRDGVDEDEEWVDD